MFNSLIHALSRHKAPPTPIPEQLGMDEREAEMVINGNEVSIVLSAQSFQTTQMRLSGYRDELRRTMSPREYEHVAPLIESCQPASLRAEMYRMAKDAYLGGALFDYCGTLADVTRVIMFYHFWYYANM